MLLEALYNTGVDLVFEINEEIQRLSETETTRPLVLTFGQKYPLIEQLTVFKTRVQDEVNVIKRVLYRTCKSNKDESLSKTSNLPHLLGIWEAYIQETGIISLRIRLGGQNVDLLTNFGTKWVRVSARNPFLLNLTKNMIGNDLSENSFEIGSSIEVDDELLGSDHDAFFGLSAPPPQMTNLKNLTYDEEAYIRQLEANNENSMRELNREIEITSLEKKNCEVEKKSNEIITQRQFECNGNDFITFNEHFSSTSLNGVQCSATSNKVVISSEEHPTLEAARNLISLSSDFFTLYQRPVVCFRFARGVSSGLKQALEQVGCTVEGFEFNDNFLKETKIRLQGFDDWLTQSTEYMDKQGAEDINIDYWFRDDGILVLNGKWCFKVPVVRSNSALSHYVYEKIEELFKISKMDQYNRNLFWWKCHRGVIICNIPLGKDVSDSLYSERIEGKLRSGVHFILPPFLPSLPQTTSERVANDVACMQRLITPRLHLDTTALVALTSDFLHCNAPLLTDFANSSWKVFVSHRGKEISTDGVKGFQQAINIEDCNGAKMRRKLVIIREALERFSFIGCRVSGAEEMRRMVRMFNFFEIRTNKETGMKEEFYLKWSDIAKQVEDKDKWMELEKYVLDEQIEHTNPAYSRLKCKCICDCDLGCKGTNPLRIEVIETQISDRLNEWMKSSEGLIGSEISLKSFGTADSLRESVLSANKKFIFAVNSLEINEFLPACSESEDYVGVTQQRLCKGKEKIEIRKHTSSNLNSEAKSNKCAGAVFVGLSACMPHEKALVGQKGAKAVKEGHLWLGDTQSLPLLPNLTEDHLFNCWKE